MNFHKILFILLIGIFKTTIFAAQEEKGILYFEQPYVDLLELCSKFPSFQLKNEKLNEDNKRLNEILKPFMAIEVSILPHSIKNARNKYINKIKFAQLMADVFFKVMNELRSEQKSVDTQETIFQGVVVEDMHQPPSEMNQYFFRLAHESIELDEKNNELEKENSYLAKLIEVFILTPYEIIESLQKEVSSELNKACESYTAWKKGKKNASLIGFVVE